MVFSENVVAFIVSFSNVSMILSSSKIVPTPTDFSNNAALVAPESVILNVSFCSRTASLKIVTFTGWLKAPPAVKLSVVEG